MPPSRSANADELPRYVRVPVDRRRLRPATFKGDDVLVDEVAKRNLIKLEDGTARPLRLARLQLQVASEQAITDRVAAAHPVGDSVDVAVSGKSSKSLTGRWRLDTTKRRFRLDLS